MKASAYHEAWDGNPFLDKIAEYASSYPSPGEPVADLDWNSPADEIFFYEDIEDLMGFDIPNDLLKEAFGGDITPMDLGIRLSGLQKEASLRKESRLSTSEEKARMRTYRMANKAQLARKAKRRRKQIASGMRIKKSRVGSAAGGYSFVAGSPAKPPTSSATTTKMAGPPPGNNQFNPKANMTSVQSMPKWRGI